MSGPYSGRFSPIFGVVADDAARAGAGLIDDIGRKIPLGFKSVEEFSTFNKTLYEGLSDAGYSDVIIAFRGSSVTGKSFHTGVPFDIGRISDLDIAVVSPELLQKAKSLGVQLRGGGTRTGPLTIEQLKDLGLLELIEYLEEREGRTVSIMIYDMLETVAERPGPFYHAPR